MLVLVVDDDREWGACIARALKLALGEDFETLTAESGIDAIRIIAKNPTKQLRAVITNYNMGPGMNGAQLAEKIIENAPPPKPVGVLRTTQINPGVVSDCFKMIRRKDSEITEVTAFAEAVATMLRRH
jgi:CheY-like chemotaxis protein